MVNDAELHISGTTGIDDIALELFKFWFVICKLLWQTDVVYLRGKIPLLCVNLSINCTTPWIPFIPHSCFVLVYVLCACNILTFVPRSVKHWLTINSAGCSPNSGKTPFSGALRLVAAMYLTWTDFSRCFYDHLIARALIFLQFQEKLRNDLFFAEIKFFRLGPAKLFYICGTRSTRKH